MKLYVWDAVFCDYTCGMAFAIARSKDEAIKAILGNNTVWEEELRSIEPKVYKSDRKTPIGFYVIGGG